MANRKGVAAPDEDERFFDALESGQWPEIESQFKALAKRSGQFEGSAHSEELAPVWCAVLDAYGAAEQVHEWPAQQLLDRGGRPSRRHGHQRAGAPKVDDNES